LFILANPSAAQLMPMCAEQGDSSCTRRLGTRQLAADMSATRTTPNDVSRCLAAADV
jgi:hypothetical protein